MYIAGSLFVGLFILVPAAAARHPQNDDDHLVPTQGYVDATYERLLRRKLFLTPGNYARMVTLASTASVGESALSIYSKSDGSSGLAFITSSRADRNLWYAENGDDPAFPKKGITIKRHDAPLPKPLAEAISAAVKAMLDGARLMSAKGPVAVDPVNIEVSLQDGAGTHPRALLTPDARGPTMSSFRRLVQSLEAYCEASSPTMRSLLEKQIEAEVINLKRIQTR